MAEVEHLIRLMTEEYDKKNLEYDTIICLYVQVGSKEEKREKSSNLLWKIFSVL